MAKDPAFLFYSSDFMMGTALMNEMEVGQYIRILCHMHQSGHLTMDDMKNICPNISCKVVAKFRTDESGLYFNERLDMEVSKRKAYSESRRKNRLQGKPETYDTTHDISYDNTYVNHMSGHMENENRNTNSIINTIKERQDNFYKSLVPYLEEVGKDVLREFYDYWTEASPNAKKMRFEKEKAFDTKKRLNRWVNSQFKKKGGEEPAPPMDPYAEARHNRSLWTKEAWESQYADKLAFDKSFQKTFGYNEKLRNGSTVGSHLE